MWRAMGSLLVLRDQVNALAPTRSRASDGLVGDEDHQGTNSDHNPHYVPGVGSEIVTALDLTHDPAHGFDSFAFAEVLRTHRDRRIKYVISNRRICFSYVHYGTPAWTWKPYGGSDPHTNHVHISVLDDPIADTRTPWDLEGFDMADFTADQYKAFPWQYSGRGIGENNGTTIQKSTLAYLDEMLKTVRLIATKVDIDATELAAISKAAETGVMAAVDDIVAAVLAALPDTALTKDDVEAAVRDVFADAGQA